MSRCVSVLFAVAFSMILAASADAQAPQRWNGPYIGANLGYGWADIGGDLSATNPVYGPAGHGIDADGAFGGVQAGFNRRMGNFFIGVEADLQTAGISGSTTTQEPGQGLGKGPGFTYAASASVDWFGTTRARGGYATNAMLIYATGGLAFGGVDYDATYKTSKGTAHLSSDETHVGFVLGAGVELALRSNWSLKVEYQYLNFGDQSASGSYSWTTKSYVGCDVITTTHTNTVTSNIDTDLHTLRIGLNYAFGAEPRHQPLK